MIYLQTSERLGNQMFQYAFARKILNENPHLEGICIQYRGRKDWTSWWGNELENFCLLSGDAVECNRIYKNNILVTAYRGIRKLIIVLLPGLLMKYDTLILKWQSVLNKFGIYIPLGNSKHPQNFVSTKKKNAWIIGNSGTEIPEYFQMLKDQLCKEFEPIKELDCMCKKQLEEIKLMNSVCVSIRKGDFLNPENRRFNICSDLYFDGAIQTIKNYTEDPVFYIFSDDICWVRNNMDFKGIKVKFEANDGKNTTSDKLQLMKACKHFVMSNSTFSWWTTFLGEKEDSIVVAPFPWRESEPCNYFYKANYHILNASTGLKIEFGDLSK